MAIFVLAIFMLSIVPLAFAESTDDVDTDDEVRMEDDKMEVRERVRVRDGEVEVRSKVKKGEDGLEVRERAKLKLRAADVRERVRLKLTEKQVEARGIFRSKVKVAKDKFRENRKDINKLKDDLKDCSEDCDVKKKDLRKGVLKHLEKSVEVISKSLERLENRFSEMEGSEDSLENIAMLNEKLASIKETHLLNEDPSREEVRVAIRDLKALWNEIKKEQKFLAGKLVNEKLGDIAAKHEGIVNSMEKRIANLEDSGVDASDLKSILDRFKAHVDELNANYDASKAEFNDAADKKGALDDWKASQKQVREDMRVSRDILREFTKKFVELKKSANGEVSDEVEDEVETEDENESEDEAESDDDGEVVTIL